MKTKRQLQIEATKACKFRGHVMLPWESSEFTGFAECKLCGCYAQVIVNPRPNEKDIGGTAVALNCTRKL